MRKWLLMAPLCLLTLGGCARNTQVVAPGKEFVPADSVAPWKIGGTFDKRDTTIVIHINGENVLRGRFPPMTPRLTADGTYQGKAVRAACAFSSDVIAKKSSGFELQIAEAIVSKATKTGGNTCELTVDGRPAATLYF
jgi:hypothetical protein